MGWTNQVVQASRVEISGVNDGLFVYTGTPGPGNLQTSIASQASTDEYTNPYPAGVKVFGVNGSYVAIDPTQNGGVPYLFMGPPGAVHVVFPPQVIGTSYNTGLANEAESLALSSGQANAAVGTTSVLNLYSRAQDGSTASRAAFIMDTHTVTLGTTFPTSYLPVTQVDNQFTTQTGTSPSRLFKTWAIPNFDFITGTTYRLSSFGVGTWGGVPVTFNIASPWGSLASLPVGGTELVTGATFMWDLMATVIVNQTGSNGIISGSIRLNLAQFGGNQLTNLGTANSAGGFVSAGDLSPVNVTTTGGNLTVQVAFAAGGTSPSITSLGSVLERIGANPT